MLHCKLLLLWILASQCVFHDDSVLYSFSLWISISVLRQASQHVDPLSMLSFYWVNSAGQGVQKVLDQVTEAGQKVVDDTCKAAQDTGEKAAQSLTSQVTAWGTAFGQSEDQKNVST